MKTVEDLNRLIRDEITAIEALRSEDEKIWSVRGGVTEANAKRSKKIRRMIGDHNNEIAHLRRLIRFVEATPEEGIRMMLDQLRGQVDRITASADRYKLKEQKKEYLTRAGAQLKHTQIAELEFLGYCRPICERCANGGGRTYVRSGEKIGRNEPCPCGSGLKYKKYCGK